MNLLTAEGITKSFGERNLLKQVTFSLEEGEKAGVIGINGAGKSTFLKILAGLEEPDEGRVVTAGNTVIRYLPQHPVFPEEETVLLAVLKEREGGADYDAAHPSESDAKAMLTRLGVTDFEARCGTLSGGQKKRLALVAALLSPADILILDEPTNHLDHEMADWLEETLKRRKGAVIMVTHDRYFLDSVTDRILEIDRGQLYSYRTSYSGYLERKAEREEAASAGERKRISLLRTELKWVRRGARARSTKQKARLERYEELRQTQGPAADTQVEMSSLSTRLGKTTVEVSHLSKSYGEKTLIRDFSYIFLRNDRIGFIGPNGSGKTTLMKLLTGACEPDEGTVEKGQTVKLGYYGQELDDMWQQGGERQQGGKLQAEIKAPAQGKRVIDYIRDVAEYVKTEDGSVTASQMLERFLFIGSDQYTPVEKLSGGEKRRLNLLRVLMGAPNVLILDEPTNDLDIPTLTVLEDYLDRFDGIVIVISHDRYFLDRVVRRIFAFEGDGRIRQYEGGYTDYLLRRQEESRSAALKNVRTLPAKQEKTPEAQDKNGKPRAKKLKFTWQEQRDYETIEADIVELEERIGEIEGKMMQAARDFVRLNELAEEKEKTEAALEEKMERWMYLEELGQRIEEGPEGRM